MPDNDTTATSVEPFDTDEPSVDAVDEPTAEPTVDTVNVDTVNVDNVDTEPEDEPEDESTVDTVDEPTVSTVDDEPAQTEEDLVVTNPLSEEEQAEQDRQEVIASALEPGQTLPWVAEPPSGVALERAVEAVGGDDAENEFPADEDAEGVGSDIDSSRTEETTFQQETQETETEATRSE